jgi:predicted component of type VI protein secretion system
MQGSDSYRLIVRRGPQPNQVYELTDEVMNLGRDITNQLVINDREVSRHHLRFVRGSDGITMEDLGSTNGTFINGRRVTGATLLKNGDMIGLGETVTLGYEVVRAGMNNVAVYPTPGAAQQPTIPAQAAPQQPAAASPYQPPQNPAPVPQQPPAASPYQPPAQPAAQPFQPTQPVPDPYAPPAYQQPGQQPAYDPYGQQPAYNDPYAQQQGAYNPPPPPGYAGYDQHDPFGMREEEGSSSTRIFLYGCAAAMILCCCCTLFGFLAVDSLCLYDKIPGLGQIIRALGIGINCGVR